NRISGSAWFNKCCSVTGLVDVRLRSSDRPKPSCTSTHTKGCECVRPGPHAPPRPRLGRRSPAVAAAGSSIVF
ncbi:hypothetical protein T492DRAFT_948209, partial [Pavlovales sp. CCMP2436]